MDVDNAHLRGGVGGGGGVRPNLKTTRLIQPKNTELNFTAEKI